VTSQEPRNPPSADPDIPDTEVIVVSAASPVFVDSTGRRRRVLRRLSYAFGGICIVYGGLVSVALAGGPVSPSTVLPLPDLGNDDGEQAEVRASPAAPQPTSTKLITEALPPRAAPIRRPIENRKVAPRPAPAEPPTVRTPAPRPPTTRVTTPAPSVAPTRPVESTVVPTPSISVPPVPTTPPVVKGKPPLPPAPPATATAMATEQPDTGFDPDSADTDFESPEPEGPA
jgi:hypothetical protein